MGRTLKVTAQDVAQMSDSQRIMFNAGRAFELDRIVKLLKDAGYPENMITKIKGDR